MLASALIGERVPSGDQQVCCKHSIIRCSFGFALATVKKLPALLHRIFQETGPFGIFGLISKTDTSAEDLENTNYK